MITRDLMSLKTLMRWTLLGIPIYRGKSIATRKIPMM